SGSYSAALFGLKRNADATSCVPAAFSTTMSPAPDASGSAGPLTGVRLLRTGLLFFAVFAGRADLAMYGSVLPRRRRGCVVRRRHARFHDDLDARVVFIAERAIHGRGVLGTNRVRDVEGRVDLAVFDALEQDGHVPVHVRLAHLEGQALGERSAQRKL